MARHRQSLLRRLSSPSVLERACFDVCRGAKPQSCGPDGETIQSFKNSYKQQIKRLSERVKRGDYTPAFGKGVGIKKGKGGALTPSTTRPITVHNVSDRIVFRAVLNIIWTHVRDVVHTDVSFGGIRPYHIRPRKLTTFVSPRKCVETAARRILELRRDGYCFTFETDIKNFFPAINKTVLLEKLRNLLPDESLLPILECAIATEVSNRPSLEDLGIAECWNAELGVPQGGVLSPLFANLYLADFDELLVARGFQLVRYVDDLVILTKTHEEATCAYEICHSELGKIGLHIHILDEPNEKGRIKTRILEANQSFDFLGLTFHKKRVVPQSEKVQELRKKILSFTNGKTRGRTLIDVISDLNHLLRGWAMAYSFTDFSPSDVDIIDRTAVDGLVSWLAFHRIIQTKNAIAKEDRCKLGLWSVKKTQFRPISREVFGPSP